MKKFNKSSLEKYYNEVFKVRLSGLSLPEFEDLDDAYLLWLHGTFDYSWWRLKQAWKNLF